MDSKQYLEELRLLGEEVQQLEEKNCPTNPSKWSYYKSQAKQKFDVYPSAYANGWASKQYKAAGGGWKQCAGESMENTNENFAVHMMVAKAIADQKVKNPETKKDVRVTTALKDKQHPAHGKAKSLVQRLKDKFSKKESIDEKMITPQRGHNYYQLYRDTPIKYVSGHSGIGLKVPGVLLHNEYDTIKGKEGAYIIDYFGAHFYVDMKNKFASRIAHPDNREQNKDLRKNMGRTALAPEHKDWKKYMNESVNEGVINELSADTYKNTVKAALQRGDSKGNSIAVKALQSFGKAIAKELAGKSFEVAGAKGINLAKGFYRGDSKKFINQFQMTFTGEGDFIESRNVKVFGSDEAHFHMKVEFQVPNNQGGWSTDLKFKGYEKYKFPGTIQFSIKQGNVWVWYRGADTSLEFTRAGAREMAKLADIIVTAMDFPTKAKHNTIKQFDPMKVSNESVNEGKKRFRQQDGIGKAKYTISYHDGKEKHKDGSDFFGIQIFKNKKDLETFRKSLLSKGYVEESVNEAASRTAMEIGGLTGMNKDAIQKFVDDNKLDIEKVYQYVKNGKLPERMGLVSAIAGKPGNTVQTKLIKKFK